MSTIDNEQLIKKLIENDGYYEGDPQVYLIVEYTNAYGNKTWGVTWSNELPERRLRYLIPTEFVQNPKIIWACDDAKKRFENAKYYE